MRRIVVKEVESINKNIEHGRSSRGKCGRCRAAARVPRHSRISGMSMQVRGYSS
jgi:hypothetical protein